MTVRKLSDRQTENYKGMELPVPVVSRCMDDDSCALEKGGPFGDATSDDVPPWSSPDPPWASSDRNACSCLV